MSIFDLMQKYTPEDVEQAAMGVSVLPENFYKAKFISWATDETRNGKPYQEFKFLIEDRDHQGFVFTETLYINDNDTNEKIQLRIGQMLGLIVPDKVQKWAPAKNKDGSVKKDFRDCYGAEVTIHIIVEEGGVSPEGKKYKPRNRLAQFGIWSDGHPDLSKAYDTWKMGIGSSNSGGGKSSEPAKKTKPKKEFDDI